MIDTLNNTTDSRLRYRSPEVRVIEVKARGVLCGSPGNESMGENDITDAFHQN